MPRTNSTPQTPLQKSIRWALYLCYLGGIAWLSAKLFWRQQAGIPLTGPVEPLHIWQFFYPELKRSGAVDELRSPTSPLSSQGKLRILLLGGSVLEQVAPELEVALNNGPNGDRYQLFSLCWSARTSRDSYLKYDYLVSRGFDCDLVVFYHGINDVRMNCCPPDQFRDDYTHCSFYKSFQRRLEAGKLNLTSIAQDYIDNSIPLGEPDQKYRDYGHDIKTRKAFDKNVRGIIQLANQHNQSVVVMTFASHLPDAYSREKFEAKQLGYGSGQYEMPVESWGDPQAVRLGIAAHNEIIRAVATDLNVRLIDQELLLHGTDSRFSDVCHLSQSGLESFVENLLPVVLEHAR